MIQWTKQEYKKISISTYFSLLIIYQGFSLINIHTLIMSLFLSQEIEVLQNFFFFARKIACII